MFFFYKGLRKSSLFKKKTIFFFELICLAMTQCPRAYASELRIIVVGAFGPESTPKPRALSNAS